MSNIKTIILDPLQEQFEELGYASIGEAIADGWSSSEVMSTGTTK